MSYSFWGSYNAKYSLVKQNTKISLMKDEHRIWEIYIDTINMTSADVCNNGTVIIHSDKMCYIIKAGTSLLEPIMNFPYDNICKSNGKFVKFSDDGLHCMYLKYEQKKGFSLFGSKQTINDKTPIEYELVLFELETQKSTVIHKFTVINKISNLVFWNVSKDFTTSFLVIPREDGKILKFDIKRFDLRNPSNVIKTVSIPECRITYTDIYKTGTILLMLDNLGSKTISLITPEFEIFNIPLENSESCFYLARGFVVLEKIGASSERIFTIKGFKGNTVATYSMEVFKQKDIDFELLFNDKDFLTIVYYFKDKFYCYPADVLTLTTEIRRFEMILESDRQSKVYETGTSYFEDYCDAPNLDEDEYVEEKKPEKKQEVVEKPKMETPVKRNHFTQPTRQMSFTPKKETPKQKVLKVNSDFSNLSIPKTNSIPLETQNTVNEPSNMISLDFSQNRAYDSDVQQNSYSQQFQENQIFQNRGRDSGRLSLNSAPQQQYQEQGYVNNGRNSGRLNLNSLPQQQYQEQGYANNSIGPGLLSLNSVPQRQYQEQGFLNSGRGSGNLNFAPQQQYQEQQRFQENGINSGRISINSNQVATNNMYDNADMSYIDSQTGLYNSDFRDKKFAELAEESKKYGTEFSVLRIVLDNYQYLEAHHGERYLFTIKKMVIDLINRAFPKDCFISVLSACEFSVIMNSVSLDEAYSKAFDLHQRISGIRFTYQPEGLSSSIIVGTFPALEPNIQAFKDHIEAGVIFAMSSGGNQVVSLRELEQEEDFGVSEHFKKVDNFDKLSIDNNNKNAYKTFLGTDEKKDKKVEQEVDSDEVAIKKIKTLLASIEDRYLLGEINEESYKDLKSKYIHELNLMKNKKNKE